MQDTGEEIQTIRLSHWIRRGNMLLNASCLDIDDPEHLYNQALEQGVDPTDFGIEDPLEEMFGDWSVGKLRREVYNLRKELESVLRWQAAG